MPKSRSYFLIIAGTLLVILAFVLNATFILPRELWFVLGLLSVAAGLIILLKQKFTTLTTPASPPKNFENLRLSGHHIRITLDNCEVKHRSFQQDADEELLPSQTASVDALFQPKSSTSSAEVNQTYLVVEKTFNGMPYKFVSHPSPLDPVTVKMRIEQKGGDLYIDKADPTVYYFQLPY